MTLTILKLVSLIMSDLVQLITFFMIVYFDLKLNACLSNYLQIKGSEQKKFKKVEKKKDLTT